MDPYRGSNRVGTCPRCANATETDGEMGRLACVRGCGEWYPRVAFERVWSEVISGAHKRAEPWPWTPAPCPECQQPLVTSYREEVRFDVCPLHGVWLDAGEYERFATLFAGS